MNSKKYTGSFYIPEQPVVRRARRGSLVKITQITQLHPGSSNSPTTHTPLRKLCKCFWKHANATFQFPDFNPQKRRRTPRVLSNMMGGQLPLEATPRPGRPAPQSLAMPFPHQQCAVLGCGFRADKPPRAQDTFELLHSSSAQLLHGEVGRAQLGGGSWPAAAGGWRSANCAALSSCCSPLLVPAAV